MHAHVKGLAGYNEKRAEKEKERNQTLLKRISTSSVMNPHMKWERGSAIYFFNRCYKKKKLGAQKSFLHK